MKLEFSSKRNLFDDYRREIVLILVIKLVLIVTIKQVFFSNPISNTLTPETVSETIFGINPVDPHSSPSHRNIQ
jgi:hypothetical protein